jgi:PIN domain nuclease of toxin-antitoxin system
MRALLDTQILYLCIGLTLDQLPRTVRPLLEDPDADLVVSAASIMEISIKGILSEQQTHKACLDLRLEILPFTSEHAYRLFSLPMHHRDPFDRMIIATALVEDIPVVGSDKLFRKYKGLKVIG